MPKKTSTVDNAGFAKKEIGEKSSTNTKKLKLENHKDDGTGDIVIAEGVQSDFDDQAALIPEGDKVLSAIGYISFLCILPLVIRPKSSFCQFHGKQALVLFVFFFVISIFVDVLQVFFYRYGDIWLDVLYGLCYACIAVWTGYHAYKGQLYRLPLIANLSEKYLRWDTEEETEEEQFERETIEKQEEN